MAGFVLLALLLYAQQGEVVSATENKVDVELVIWEFEEDYPGSQPDDSQLPLRRVYIKTHDGIDWMSVYDGNPAAINGPDRIRELIDIFRQQGIDVIAWFVPKGDDIEAQLQMARAVLDTGVQALYADVESHPGFCELGCRYLAQNFWWRLRAERPAANLGVIYDPRPFPRDESSAADWLAVANSALPMCYWDDFVDQPPWNDPAGCVQQAHADLGWLAPYTSLEYVPMLQGQSTGAKVANAVEASKAIGSTRVSVWRRGVVPAEVWSTVAAFANPVTPPPAPAPPPPPPPPPVPAKPCEGCAIKESSASSVYVVYGGAKFPVPQSEVSSSSFAWTVQTVPDGFLSTIPDVPVGGTLLREANSTLVFRVRDDRVLPLLLCDRLAVSGYDPTAVKVIPTGALTPYSNGAVSRLRKVGLRGASLQGSARCASQVPADEWNAPIVPPAW